MFSGIAKSLKRQGKISDKANRAINLVIGIAILVGGLLTLHLISDSENDYQRLIASGNTAVATITNIQTSSIKSENGGPRRFYENKTYSYSVNDIEYTFKDRKEKTANSPQKGSTVNVFYDKENPSKAVVQRVVNDGPYSKILSYLFIVIGSIITINCIRAIRNS